MYNYAPFDASALAIVKIVGGQNIASKPRFVLAVAILLSAPQNAQGRNSSAVILAIFNISKAYKALRTATGREALPTMALIGMRSLMPSENETRSAKTVARLPRKTATPLMFIT